MEARGEIEEKDRIQSIQSDLDTRSSCTETNSDTESISDEERVRRLFAVCDADGDGYIDRYT
jgi:Ca2+-binding EF-hand superfamily protein